SKPWRPRMCVPRILAARRRGFDQAGRRDLRERVLDDAGELVTDAVIEADAELTATARHSRPRLLRARSTCRFASRSATVRRLSRTFLPRASASSTFTRPSLK